MQTPNLSLPYILPSQAQKHVTHNEALIALDAVVQLAVASRLVAPPASPAPGQRHLIDAPASAEFAGREGQIASFVDGAWRFHAPMAGWLCYVAADALFNVFDGNGWQPLQSAQAASVPLFGVNATADSVNRLSVSSQAVLFNHEGAGQRIAINKNAAADTASIIFQQSFSGRAEIGLAGSDDLKFKVSADGNVWKDALVINRLTGAVRMPATVPPKIGGVVSASASIAAGQLVQISAVDLQVNTLAISTFSSGVLTVGAGEEGLWNFEFQAVIPGPAATKGVYIRVNGDIASVMQFANTSASEVLKTAAAVQLSAGDQVTFAIFNGTTTAQQPNTTRLFGYRISA
jgi:hypothetical protein